MRKLVDALCNIFLVWTFVGYGWYIIDIFRGHDCDRGNRPTGNWFIDGLIIDFIWPIKIYDKIMEKKNKDEDFEDEFE